MKFTLFVALVVGAGAAGGYDPLDVAAPAPEPKDIVVKDAKRKRDLPVRVYLPAGGGAAPVVLFSHGLGGNKEGSSYLGKHWAGRGYAAVFLQHPGSDDAVWKDAEPALRMSALKNAANAANLLLRVRDVPAILDQLTKWTADPAHPLSGRLDLKRVGMSGHSFGAVTTQAVSGQAFPLARGLTDPRIKAAVVMSPSGPQAGEPKTAFAGVKLPWLLLTGTQDRVPFAADPDPKTRLVVFPALPPGGKYELVLDGAEHGAFTDRPLPGEGRRNPIHHRAILAVTTAFWDAYLKGDPAAKAWLDGDGPRSVLEKDDRWRKK